MTTSQLNDNPIPIRSKPRNLASVVVEHLTRRIKSDDLKVGEKLATESDIMQVLGSFDLERQRSLHNRSDRPKFGSRSGPVIGHSEHRRFKIRSRSGLRRGLSHVLVAIPSTGSNIIFGSSFSAPQDAVFRRLSTILSPHPTSPNVLLNN